MVSKSHVEWSEYKRARTDVTLSIRRAKASHFTEMFHQVRDSSAYWNLVNKAMVSKVRKGIGPIRREDNTLAVKDRDKANAMNSFFSAVSDKLNGQLPALSACGTICQAGYTNVPQLSRVTINCKIVANKINSI